MAFAIKMIEPVRSLGAALRREREARGWTMLKAATVTHIRETYLTAIEEERLDALPEEPVRRNLVKRYIAALGSDERLEALLASRLGVVTLRRPVHPPTKIRTVLRPEQLKLAGLALVILALVGYLGSEAYQLTKPPALYLTEPSDGLEISIPTIAVRGTTVQNASIFVNEKPVLKDANGDFETTIDLARGVNIITVEARKKYSRPRTLYRTIIFETTPESARDPLTLNTN